MLAGTSNCSSSHKKVKVWERDTGVLHASSEEKVFMGEVLDWMPSGSKIAAVYDRKVENKAPSVVFFERNGLERNSFPINAPSDVTIELLKWNSNSDLLAAVVRYKEYDAVKVWYFCNYHWYLKHEVRYPRDDGVRFMWDPTKSLQLICWTLGGQVASYNFIWVTAVVENSVALVIDDSRVLVTPLSLSLVPPPMYSFSLNFTSAVRDIALYSKNDRNVLAAFSSDGNLSVVELPMLDAWEELEGKEFYVEPSASDTTFSTCLHLAWLDSDVLVAFSISPITCSSFATSSNDARGFFLLEIGLECSENPAPSSVTYSGWHAKVTYRNSIDGLVIGISPNTAKKLSAFLQFDDGNVFGYSSKFGTVKSDLKGNSFRFSSPCPWMDVVHTSSSEPLLFGLDEAGRLQLAGKTLYNNCGSFAFYSNASDHHTTHLVLVTKQDLLFVVDMRDLLDGNLELIPESYNNTDKRRERESIDFVNIWERGAKIIGVLHGFEAAVMLQTARGNLECIYPRKLVISSIVNALADRRFRDALLMVRRHRIDFNIIVDYCGLQRFIQSASEFVKSVNNLSYITEFVCGIKNENVTEKLYRTFFALPGNKESKDVQGRGFKASHGDNKVSAVLLAVRKALEEHIEESPSRELCILTTLARSEPPALEEALGRIKLIRERELSGSSDPKKVASPSAEEAIKHLLWLSDSEAVYESALGLYDLNLAAIVALNSQRDPKEFLPFLKDLESMPAVLMQYKIDLKLRRLENAIKHIVSAGEAYFSDCMNLMKENPELFPLGLELITDSRKRALILEAWGDHLTKQKCFEDAATAYLSCGRLDKALKVYRECGKWSGVLTVAGLLKLGNDEVERLAHELCEELQALGKPAEAAKVALEYCEDVNGGISLLIAAREWEEALRVSLLHSREDLMSEVKNASLECARNLIIEYKESLEKVGKYLTRYLAVRQRRLLLAAKLQSEDRSVNDLDDDAASETSSAYSGMSVYTTRYAWVLLIAIALICLLIRFSPAKLFFIDHLECYCNQLACYRSSL